MSIAASAKALRRYIQSPKAVIPFATVAWKGKRLLHGQYRLQALVTYGIAEDVEMEVCLYRDGSWYLQMWLPPVVPQALDECNALCAGLMPTGAPLQAVVDEQGVFVEAGGQAFTTDAFDAAWQAFGDADVYEKLLYIMSCSREEAYDET